MPSKARWTLNPRKWFGGITNHMNKRDKNQSMQTNPVVSPTSSSSTSTVPSVTQLMVPPAAVSSTRLPTGRQRSKVSPAFKQTIEPNENRVQSACSATPYQMPAFGVRREMVSPFLSMSKWAPRSPNLVTVPTEPSIRKKNDQNDLFVDGTRTGLMTASIATMINFEASRICNSSNVFSQYGNSQGKLPHDNMDLNVSSLSNQCLVDYPQETRSHIVEPSSMSSRTRSSSSLEDIDDGHESSSSGVFTDERADLHEGQRAPSKDTLSTTDARSIESIFESQLSLNQYPIRPGFLHICRSGRLMVNEEKPTTIKVEATRTVRCQSSEGLIKENRFPTTTVPRKRQTSAAISKKIERRAPSTNRVISATPERSGFVRISNDAYRMTKTKNDLNQRIFRQNSFTDFSRNDEDSLPNAHEEKIYAELPRASSTEQLNSDNYADIRAMVDDCLRPTFSSRTSSSVTKTKLLTRSAKSSPHPKRFQMNQQQLSTSIDEITDRLVSSVNPSIYTQYQRCPS